MGVHLPMQGTWVWSLFQEESTCHRATKLTGHNCWARGSRAQELQLLSPHAANDWSPHAVEPILQNKRSLCTTRRERLHATRSPHTAVRTQCRQQNKFKKKKKKITVRIVSQVSLKDCLLCYNSQVDMNKIFHLFLKHTYTHYSWPLNNTGLNCMGPFMRDYF